MRRSGRLRAGLLALAASGALAGGAAGELPPLLYELPEAGSYQLPAIHRVSDHRLLDADGRRASLLGPGGPACSVVAFVYLSCTDAQGCPLALAALQRADRVLAKREDLRGRVRLVTVSFDPERDTPGELAKLRHHMAPRTDWRFLTAADQRELRPVLEDFGQDAVPVLTADGRDTGLMRHVAKVFLVDHRGAVRNVYSSGFLDHRLLLRDVETLLVGGGPPTR